MTTLASTAPMLGEGAKPTPSPIVVWAILLSNVLPALVLVGLSPILPQLEAHFHDQAGASLIVRCLVSLVGPTYIVGAPLAGLLAVRVGERRVMITAAIIFGIAGCTAAMLDNLYGILASRIVVGLSVAMTNTLATVVLTKLYEGQARNRWLGYYGASSASFVLMMIPVCGYLGAINWRLVFAAHAVAFPLVVMFIIGLPRTARAVTTTSGQRQTEPRSTMKVPWTLVLLGLACGAATSSASLFVPFHLVALGVKDPARMGMILLPAAFASVVGSFLFGPVRGKLSALGTFALAFSLAATGFLIVALTTELKFVVLGLAISGFCAGILAMNLFAITANRSSDADRSRIFGFVKGAYFAGPMASQFVLEPVVHYANAAAAILIVGIFAACLALGFLKQWRVERLSYST